MRFEDAPFESTRAVLRHPRLDEVARDGDDLAALRAFAGDLAAWLVGAPRSALAPLARVITVLAGRGLRDARRLARGRPLLAVEAGARAAATLWPLLRDPPSPEAPDDTGADGGPAGDAREADGGAGLSGLSLPDGAEGQGAEDGEGSGEADDETSEDGEGSGQAAGEPTEDADGSGTPDDEEDDDPWTALIQDQGDDPELDRLAAGLAEEDDPDGVLEALADASWEAARETDEMARTIESLVPGLGWGSAPGRLRQSLLSRLDRLTALVAMLPELRHIADTLGRMESDARKQASEQGGSEEVTGVRLGGEVSRALPSELGLLGDPDTEDLFYQRYAERRLVSLELTGAGLDGVAAPDRRGPVIAAIDTSGSMHGAPEQVAKAAVIAIARRVLPEGRPVHLLLFGSRGELTELRLSRRGGGLEDLLDFLVMGFQGGTDFDTPLVRALELLEERSLERADILVVTDGHAVANPFVVEQVVAARQGRGLRVWSLVVGREPGPGVEAFSDEVWCLDPSRRELSEALLRRLGEERGR